MHIYVFRTMYREFSHSFYYGFRGLITEALKLLLKYFYVDVWAHTINHNMILK